MTGNGTLKATPKTFLTNNCEEFKVLLCLYLFSSLTLLGNYLVTLAEASRLLNIYCIDI